MRISHYRLGDVRVTRGEHLAAEGLVERMRARGEDVPWDLQAIADAEPCWSEQRDAAVR